MFSRISSAVCAGIEGRNVYVETDVASGLPGIYIVGLASTMIMESRERIRSAIVNSGLEYPRGRITINLTPASLHKTGSCLDLPIAIGVLTSNLYVDPVKASGYGIIGELALDGRILGVDGALPVLMRLRDSGVRKIIVPAANIPEASLISGCEIYAVSRLPECVALINGKKKGIPVSEGDIESRLEESESELTGAMDYIDISGQEGAKRAITIAVAGRHGLLMVGSPGCGKTMLASRIPTIMPRMSEEELIETAIIYSAAGKNNGSGISMTRPFRHPHHTIGRAGLIGGGSTPVPGEISLAHNGVLFLDEACEFEKDKIEALRIPIEEKKITHFRKGESYVFPCRFQLVMASNPCPCGYYGDPDRLCKCSEAQLARYRRRLSGPIMDRIEMRIVMEKVTYSELRNVDKGISSADMRASVLSSIDFARSTGRTRSNADLTEKETDRFCALGRGEESFMRTAYESLKMSPRSYKRTLKVARTIADLDHSVNIRTEHLAEALSYRLEENVN